MTEIQAPRSLFWRRKRKQYPNAILCLGSEVGEFHGRFWWHATGTALDEYTSAKEDILSHLNALFTDSYCSTVHFRLYMIGHSRGSAVPTVMFFCANKEPRKKAKKAVDDSGIMTRLPGFQTGHHAMQPGVGVLVQPATEHDRWFGQMNSFSATEVYFDRARPICDIGMPIFVNQGDDRLRQATANAVYHKGKYVFMTVAHIFTEIFLDTHIDQDDFDDEYDFGSGTEDGYDNEDMVNATSRASISTVDDLSEEQLETNLSNSDSSKIMEEDINYMHIIPSSPLFPVTMEETRLAPSPNLRLEDATSPSREHLHILGYLKQYSTDQDWALIEVVDTNVSLNFLSNIMGSRGEKSSTVRQAGMVKIAARTSHGTILGFLSETSVYIRLPGSVNFEEVYEVNLDSPLAWGDCGTAVFDAVTGHLHGHIVASSKTGCIVYIMTAHRVFTTAGVHWNAPAQVPLHIFYSNKRRAYEEIHPRQNHYHENSTHPLSNRLSTLSVVGANMGFKVRKVERKVLEIRVDQSLIQLMFQPVQTDTLSHYEAFVNPPFVSIGRALDPFSKMFQPGRSPKPVEELMYEFVRDFGTKAMATHWLPLCIEKPHSFFSALYISSAYHDAIEGSRHESLATLTLRQEVITLINDDLCRPGNDTSDQNIIALIQLIAGEAIAREDVAVKLQERGLVAMLEKRGGLNQLPSWISSAVSWIILECAILGEVIPRTMYREFSLYHSIKNYMTNAIIPESPLYRPRGNRFRTLNRSSECSYEALELMMNVAAMLQNLLNMKAKQPSQTMYKNLLENTISYPSILELRGEASPTTKDWKMEAIRIVALIQATAIRNRTPLSDVIEQEERQENPSSCTISVENHPWSIMKLDRPAPISFSSGDSGYHSSSSTDGSYTAHTSITPNHPSSSTTARKPRLLESLKNALEKSNLADCWSDMAGVLLWIGLTAGAASRKSDKAFGRWFSAVTVRVSFMLAFEHPEAVHATLLRMGKLVEKLQLISKLKEPIYVAAGSSVDPSIRKSES